MQALRDLGVLAAFPIEVPEDIPPLFYQRETAANVGEIGFWPVNYLAPQVFGAMNQIVQGLMGGMLTVDEFMDEMQETHSTYLAANPDG